MFLCDPHDLEDKGAQIALQGFSVIFLLLSALFDDAADQSCGLRVALEGFQCTALVDDTDDFMDIEAAV